MMLNWLVKISTPMATIRAPEATSMAW